MKAKQDKSTKRNVADGNRAVSRFFPSSVEEAEAYLRANGIDPEKERAYGRKVIAKLRAEIEAKKITADEQPWHPGCPKRPSEGDCNCG